MVCIKVGIKISGISGSKVLCKMQTNQELSIQLNDIMNLVQNIFKFIKNHNLIKEGDNVIVGISGGPDSTCLLHILCQINAFFPISIYAAHFNYELRGEESEQDETFVTDFCKQLNVPLYVNKFSLMQSQEIPISPFNKVGKRGLSSEEKYRFIRYHWFDKLAEKLNASKIAVAHTADDQLETVIMRLIKGSVSGLSGMKIKRPLGESFFPHTLPQNSKLILIRPFLYTSRDEILKYCEKFDLKPRLDSSNLCLDFDRNRIRHNIVPIIKKENPKIMETINKSISVISEEDDYLNNVANNIFDLICNSSFNSPLPSGERVRGITINKKEFLKLHLAIQRRIIRMAWQKVSLSPYNINFQHVEDVIKIISAKQGTKTFSLPYKVYFFKEGDSLIFTRNLPIAVSPFYYRFINKGELYIKELNIRINVKNVGITPSVYPDNNQACFDMDLLPSDLCWRNYQQNDYITPYGMDKQIKLAKLFSNNKIPHYKRNHYLLLATGNKILWVAGLRRDNTAIITPETKNILKIAIMKFS